MVEDREWMKVILYASGIGSINYDMLCTRPIVYLANEFGKGVQWWSRSRSLNIGQNYPYLPKRTKEIFLGYGGDKEFVVKSYVDASFNTDLDDSESQSGYCGTLLTKHFDHDKLNNTSIIYFTTICNE